MNRGVLALLMGLLFAACTERNDTAASPTSPAAKETTMTEFEKLANDWQQHCKRNAMSSSSATFLDHPSYRGIVAMGEPAVPLIIERYRQDDLPWWGFALQEITGVKMIEDPNRFKPKEVKQKWLEWWDKRATTTDARPK